MGRFSSKVFYTKSSLSHSSNTSSSYRVHAVIALQIYTRLTYNTLAVLFSFTNYRKITLTFCRVPWWRSASPRTGLSSKSPHSSCIVQFLQCSSAFLIGINSLTLLGGREELFIVCNYETVDLMLDESIILFQVNTQICRLLFQEIWHIFKEGIIK